MPTFVLQFNEANFDLINEYQKTHKDLFRSLAKKQKVLTTSEAEYEDLEPWIQWASLYSGKPLAEHRCFHLGDYQIKDDDDLFIKLAKNKLRVGLFGAMNHPGDKRLTCFVPDAWSTASCDGSYPSRCAQKVVSYLVNKNVSLRSPLRSFGLCA